MFRFGIEHEVAFISGNFELYAGLLALLKGLALDQSLPGRATTPDAVQHQRVARAGLSDPAVAAQTAAVLDAASAALNGDPDAALLEPLALALVQGNCPAQHLRSALARAGSLERLLADWRMENACPTPG